MHITKLTIFTLMVTVMAGCAGTRHMDNYLDSIKLSESNSRYEHEQHGLLYQNQEPLKSVIASCLDEAIKGKSFKLGSKTISDSNVLYQVHLDQLEHMIYDIRKYKAKSSQELAGINYEIQTADGGYKSVKFGAFDNAKIDRPQLKALTQTMGVRNECIKEQGWSFYKEPKT